MTTILGILLFSIISLSSQKSNNPENHENDNQEDNSQRVCPACNSRHTIKNGSIHNGKPKYQGKDCGRQFVDKPTNNSVSDETKQLIDKLLLERLSLRGIARVTKVSWSWLQNYVNQKLTNVPRQVNVSAKSIGKLIVECDEMWSFVLSKENQLYIWLAIDRNTREIIGCFVGDRTRKSARQLWASLPGIYRQCAVAYSDFWQAYKTVIPSSSHRAVGKETGQTNHIERLNNTLRQRISRLVRKSLSFSKKLDNHIGAIWYFIHHYNEQLATI
jgi:IS1 family transposase/transposase-like protein